MLPISILEKTSNSILYEIPAGKPNPKQKRALNEETRDRVVQSAMKGASCWYYTFNLIRSKIGKNPCEELMKERDIEKLCSLRRKELTSYDDAFPISIAELYSESDNELLKQMDLKNARLFLKEQKLDQSMSSLSETLEGRSSLNSYLEEFVKENKYKNLHEFLLYKRSSKSMEINLKFLSSFATDIDKMLKHENWEKLDIEAKANALDCYVRDFTADLYKLQKSSWKPKQGIDGLIDELQKNGPLMVLGKLGVCAYIDSPFKMSKQLAGRDIYAWQPGAKRDVSSAGHTVLIIGAKKIQDKAFVYFIDSTDPSDPKDKSKQQIYMISLTNLTSNIYSLSGRKNSDSQSGYAYFGNFKI